MDFSEWINQKYKIWITTQEKGQDTIDDFAKYIGVSQQLMSFWLNGKRSPGARTIPLLAELYGNEIYEVLGLPQSEKNEDFPFAQLPLPFRERLEAATKEVNLRYQHEGISPETDPSGERALEIAEEVFDRFGINFSEADSEGS